MEPAEQSHVLGVTLEEFAAFCAGHELPPYRSKQVFEWIYRRGAADFDAMTNLAKPLRSALAQDWAIYTSTVARRQESSDGTVKLLLAWPDATTLDTPPPLRGAAEGQASSARIGESRATSECVLIPDDDRNTACISSQVGCPVGCRFCASGLNGLQRQLTAGEIVEQAMRVRELCEKGRLSPVSGVSGDGGGAGGDEERVSEGGLTPFSGAAGEGERGRLSNIVFMGLGEPLGNFAAVLKAIRIINADWGMSIGARKITVSTVGLPGQIRKLADEELQLNLAISLHAPNDELRRELIPWAENISIAEIVAAVKEYFLKTGREITLEYILLADVNDQPEHATQLSALCRKMRCNVNLIMYNPVADLGYKRPSTYAAQRFLQRLRERGVNAHLRRSRGLDIDAACGQLRRSAAGAGQH